MLTALVLICSVAARPDVQDCTPNNATTVMRLPGEFGNPAACFMRGQAYLAGSSIGRELDANTRRELSVSAFSRQERVVGDAQVKLLSSPNADGPTRLCRSVVALMVGLSTALFSSAAYPHDPQRPELNAWFKSLKSKAGEPCCDTGDGQHAEAAWDMAKGGYRVLLKNPQRPNESGQWFDVPYSAVVDQPNVSRVAMVWWSPSYDLDGTMTPRWRCFIPGAGG